MTRPEQIHADYEQLIDHHLDDLLKGKADGMLEIEDFANQLFTRPI